MKDWAWIVEDYPGNHMGPTIPFLFGAMQEPVGRPPSTQEEGKRALRALLEALRQAPDNHGVRIQWCATIGEYVVSANPFVASLAWDPIDGSQPATIDELVDLLWTRYGVTIMAGEFSFEQRAWRAFSDEETRNLEP